MPAEPTTEVLTFLFTDIEGSTARWERDRDAMAAAVRRHDELTFEAVSGAGGRVVKSTGDGAHAVFADPDSAAAAALALRDELRREEWPPAVDPIRVRMGIHSGPAEARGGDGSSGGAGAGAGSRSGGCGCGGGCAAACGGSGSP